jgi:non-homologous end joining protein Ku
MRAVSRTTLKLGTILEIPVGIAAATGSHDIKIDTFTPDGESRVQQFVHPTRTTLLHRQYNFDKNGYSEDFEPVEVPEVVTDTIKGMRIGKVVREIPESEIKAESATTALDSIEVLEFIDYRRVPTDRLNGSYWIQADPGFDKPLETMIEALRRSRTAMVVKYAVRSRQRLGVIRARHVFGDEYALLLNDVVFADLWRAPDDRVLAPNAVIPDERSVQSALEIIASMRGSGESLESAADDLPPALTILAERAVDGVYEDKIRTLELVAKYRTEDLDLRADELVAYAEKRWPELADKREEVAAVIADSGGEKKLGEKLTALVG